MPPETAAPKLVSTLALPTRGTVLAGRFEVLRPLGRRTLLDATMPARPTW